MQFNGSYEVKEKIMIEYLNRDKQLVDGFEDFRFCQILREENERADTLAKFASMFMGVRDQKIIMITSDQLEIKIAIEDDRKPKMILDLVVQIENNTDWQKEIIDTLNGIEIEDEENRRRFARQVSRF